MVPARDHSGYSLKVDQFGRKLIASLEYFFGLLALDRNDALRFAPIFVGVFQSQNAFGAGEGIISHFS